MPSWNRQQFENHGLSIGKGEVPGYSAVYKNGLNNDIDQGAIDTVWTAGGPYPWSALDTPQTLFVQSTDASDVGTVTIEGLDENWEAVEETVSFNGLTSGSTSNTFRRVNEAIYDNGNDENVGEITVRTGSSSGTVVAHIDSGLSQTLQAVYSVPLGFTAFVVMLDFGCQKGEDAQFRAFVRGGGEGRFRIAHIAEVYQNWYRYDFNVPPAFPEKTDIDIKVALVETNNTRTFSNFSVILIENNKLRR